ncbi:MAG: hypothetical protein FJZ15_01000 [Candidatus Omnitrophica bacterium]|nr:hypothetical protein [Candidatus Omnitrophota bacterium]
MMKPLFLLFQLPVLAGALILLFKEKKARARLSGLVFLITFAAAVVSLLKPPAASSLFLIGDFSLWISPNKLAGLVIVFINLFGLLIGLYSWNYQALSDKRVYFAYLLWLIAFSNLACLAGDFILFVFAWGATLALLYALLRINTAGSEVNSGADKALTIVGFGDFALILGIALYIYQVGTSQMPITSSIVLNGIVSWASFLLMLVGALAKAGCGPLHTWIPSAAETSEGPVMAILPASLDKLLGIYLLARICNDFFVLNNAALGILLIVGSLTIMFAVMMALIQHDLRKLLSYHAISQVGYMVLGFGTAVPIGIAGGIFHMINHAIYKSGLFLTGASVGQKKHVFDLEKLGGLASFMPVTFVTGLVFSLSISGVPPFNGFASKWMLYQGVIEGMFSVGSKPLMIIFLFALVAAMFGSVLTLASFIKFIHAIFLGQDHSGGNKKVSEVSIGMKAPVLTLAGLCIILGVMPVLFLDLFIKPAIAGDLLFIGTWSSGLSVLLTIIGLIIGVVFWKMQKPKNIRQDSLFTGGEMIDSGFSFPATEFYKTVQGMPLVKRAYSVIKFEGADLFNILNNVFKAAAYVFFVFIDRLINAVTNSFGHAILGLSWVLRRAHTGVLDFYLAWSLIGLAVIIFILMSVK